MPKLKRKADCHPDRNHHALGLCSACYKVRPPTDNNRSTCHPDRVYHANGFCRSCYTSKKRATCHPDQPHHSGALCKSCWSKNHYQSNPEKYQQKRESSREHAREYGVNYNKLHAEARRTYNVAYRQKNSTRIALKKRLTYLRKSYDVTMEDLNLALSSQAYKCKICKQSLLDKRINVDHCHVTGRLRGILCVSCNVEIGHIEKMRHLVSRVIHYVGFAAMSVTSISGKRTKRSRFYGITTQDIEFAYQQQAGKCAVCSSHLTDDFVIDHCHSTGRNRGLLCRKCNVGVGRIEKWLTRLDEVFDYCDNAVLKT